MTIMEIVAQGEISRRTAYRYKAYYDEVQKNNRYKKRNEHPFPARRHYSVKNPFLIYNINLFVNESQPQKMER